MQRLNFIADEPGAKRILADVSKNIAKLQRKADRAARAIATAADEMRATAARQGSRTRR